MNKTNKGSKGERGAQHSPNKPPAISAEGIVDSNVMKDVLGLTQTPTEMRNHMQTQSAAFGKRLLSLKQAARAGSYVNGSKDNMIKFLFQLIEEIWKETVRVSHVMIDVLENSFATVHGFNEITSNIETLLSSKGVMIREDEQQGLWIVDVEKSQKSLITVLITSNISASSYVEALLTGLAYITDSPVESYNMFAQKEVELRRVMEEYKDLKTNKIAQPIEPVESAELQVEEDTEVENPNDLWWS